MYLILLFCIFYYLKQLILKVGILICHMMSWCFPLMFRIVQFSCMIGLKIPDQYMVRTTWWKKKLKWLTGHMYPPIWAYQKYVCVLYKITSQRNNRTVMWQLLKQKSMYDVQRFQKLTVSLLYTVCLLRW